MKRTLLAAAVLAALGGAARAADGPAPATPLIIVGKDGARHTVDRCPSNTKETKMVETDGHHVVAIRAENGWRPVGLNETSHERYQHE